MLLARCACFLTQMLSACVHEIDTSSSSLLLQLVNTRSERPEHVT